MYEVLADRPPIERLVKIEFSLHEKQQIALESPATEILYGGAAGGGKSHLMRVAAIIWCLEIPGLQCYLYRRTFDELRKNHMEGPTGFPALLKDLVDQKFARVTQKTITFYNGSKIFLNHLQYAKSTTKYQGPDIHVLLIDEATHFSEAEYKWLFARLRLQEHVKKTMPEKYRGCFPKALLGTNPGGIGHHWVKRRFIQRPGYEPFEPMAIYDYKGVPRSGGKKRQFIPAKLEDNPSLDREEYEETLEGIGDPVLIKAFRDGDWNIVAGSMFGGSWREKIVKGGIRWPWHVHPGFRVPKTWPLWRGADDGYENPAACYWVTQDPEYKTFYVIDEIYARHLLAPDYATRVLDKDRSIPLQDAFGQEVFNDERLKGTLDLSAFTDIGQSDKDGQKQITRGEQMNRMGCKWTPVQKWPGSRVAGIQNFHRLLKPNKLAPALIDPETKEVLLEHDRPGIVFFARCVNAVRTIPALPRSKVPGDEEDIADNAEDHGFDAIRYALQYKLGKFRRVSVGGV
jgi:Terminase large subunit, T4likevirus-type, N-terminal